MKMNENEGIMMTSSATTESRRPYIKPKVQRVDLALGETLSIGCKVTLEACVDSGDDLDTGS